MFFSFLCIILVNAFSLAAVPADQVPIQADAGNHVEHRKGKVALCAMFQDEAVYLKEWIEFHRLIGVSHFYLYNNLSHDDFATVLKPYIDQGIVELFHVPFDSTVYKDFAKTHNSVQVVCYNHAINLAKKKNDWLAIIDSDEFICPVKGKDLPTLMKEYDDASALILFWQIYGTSGIWELLPGELMIEKLLMKFPENYGENCLNKSIVKPKYAKAISPHYCKFEKGYAVYPTHQRFSSKTQLSSLPIEKIRINHYTFRTESFYYNIKKPRRIVWGYNPTQQEEQAKMILANSTYDPVMLQYVPKLRTKMSK